MENKVKEELDCSGLEVDVIDCLVICKAPGRGGMVRLLRARLDLSRIANFIAQLLCTVGVWFSIMVKSLLFFYL